MLVGNFKPMLAKHGKNSDLIDILSVYIDRIRGKWQPLCGRPDFMRNKVQNIMTALFEWV
jgi:hypothetical protein